MRKVVHDYIRTVVKHLCIRVETVSQSLIEAKKLNELYVYEVIGFIAIEV